VAAAPQPAVVAHPVVAVVAEVLEVPLVQKVLVVQEV
jgi:hypothetical protein